jgi:hypothetical protein
MLLKSTLLLLLLLLDNPLEERAGCAKDSCTQESEITHKTAQACQ